jgi:hypothetical protein
MFRTADHSMRGPSRPAPIQKTLKYATSSEHLLRRLGSALVMHWDVLPDDLQDLLLDQAVLVEDRDVAPHTVEDIQEFVRTAKMSSLRAS